MESDGRNDAAKTAGFTLIELMITVVVVAILALLAYPAYNAQVLETRRSEAKAELLKAAAKQEQYYINNSGYASTMTALGYTSTTPLTENGYYQLGFTSTPTTTAFQLQAQPQGAQASDPCGTLTLDEAGVRGVVPPTGVTPPPDCW